MFCEKCGTKLIENEPFCSGCGIKVIAEEVVIPQTTVQADTVPVNKTEQVTVQVKTIPVKAVKRVCSICGKELEQDWIVCPYCKTEETGSKLCVNCKKELEQDWVVCPFCNTAV